MSCALSIAFHSGFYLLLQLPLAVAVRSAATAKAAALRLCNT